MNKDKPSVTKDSPTLLILGIICIAIAVITTAVSLVLYKTSGDIYLDRSRPGFLPDNESEMPEAPSYSFPESGNLNSDSISEYLEHFNDAIESLDALEKPFSSTPLSDESLGIIDDQSF